MLAHRQLGGNTGGRVMICDDGRNHALELLEENALMRHGRGRILGVLRRALTPYGRSDLLRKPDLNSYR